MNSGYEANEGQEGGQIHNSVGTSFTQVQVLYTTRTTIVVRAWRYGRWWLLKALTPEGSADPDNVRSLRNEFEILMKMQHPNILSASGFEYVDGLGHCIITEFIEGTTLHDWLRSEPSRKKRRRMLEQLIDAVEYIHSRGIVHGDLRAPKIMVTAGGENLKIVDFNQAEPVGIDQYGRRRTATGGDFSDDIYNLGAILADMKLGYGPIARRCRLNRDRRYANIGELKEDMEQRNRRVKMVGIFSVAGVVLLLGIAIVVQQEILDSVQSRYTDRELEQAGMADSLEVLADTIYKIREENFRLTQEQIRQQQRRELVEEAIEQGKRVIDSSLEQSDIEAHLDTLTSIDYIWLDYKTILKRVEDSPQPYLYRIGPNFTEVEMLEIKHALDKYAQSLIAPVNARIERISSWKY